MSAAGVCCPLLARAGLGHLCQAPRGIGELRQCLWAASQARPGQEMPEELRPDRCRVVLGPASFDHPEVLSVHPADDLSWRREPVRGWLRDVIRRGAVVVLMVGARRTVLRGGAI